MSQLTLPGLARKRRDLGAEAAITCATGTPIATHLTDDRRREPSFDDLVAGNRREPSHEDLLADDAPAEKPRPKRYPGVAVDTMAWLREQDVDDQLAAVAAKAAQWLREQEAADKQLAAPAPATPIEEPPAPTVPAGDTRLLFDALDALDRLPGLYAVDAKSFEMAASTAAIQTYLALRPDLLDRHEVQMYLAPLAAELAEVTR